MMPRSVISDQIGSLKARSHQRNIRVQSFSFSNLHLRQLASSLDSGKLRGSRDSSWLFASFHPPLSFDFLSQSLNGSKKLQTLLPVMRLQSVIQTMTRLLSGKLLIEEKTDVRINWNREQSGENWKKTLKDSGETNASLLAFSSSDTAVYHLALKIVLISPSLQKLLITKVQRYFLVWPGLQKWSV